MDLSLPESEDIRNFMAQYYPEIYKQTKYGYIHLLQLNTRKYIRKILDEQGLNSKKTLLRHLSNVMKKINDNIVNKYYTTEGTWIIKGWDGNDLTDPRFVLFANILAEADTEENSSLETARDFFNKVRQAINTSNETTSDKQALKLAKIWIEQLRDEILGTMWEQTPQRHRKISKLRTSRSVQDTPIPVVNNSGTLSVAHELDSNSDLTELNNDFLAEQTRAATGA
jgi:hypothetical protein